MDNGISLHSDATSELLNGSEYCIADVDTMQLHSVDILYVYFGLSMAIVGQLLLNV